jgi:hypothetical protein
MPRKKPSKRQKEAAALLRELKPPNLQWRDGRWWFLVEAEPHLKIYGWLRRVAREKETKFRLVEWKTLERFEELQRQFPSEKAPQIFERLTKELNGGGKTNRKQIRSVRKRVAESAKGGSNTRRPSMIFSGQWEKRNRCRARMEASISLPENTTGRPRRFPWNTKNGNRYTAQTNSKDKL